MKIGTCVVVLGAFLLAGCAKVGVGGQIGARELRPPQTGIFVGGLYAAIEDERRNAKGPLSLRSLCRVSRSLAEFNVPAPNADPDKVANIDLIQTVLSRSDLKGLNLKLASVNLNGSFSDYYEYKIVNVTKYYIEGEIADQVFEGLMRRPHCRRAFTARVGDKRIYQVLEVYSGDIVFTRKREREIGGDVAVKLKAVEPSLKATLSDTLQLGFSGTGLVFGVGTEARDSVAGTGG
ncbi:hypothetical protein [Ancylobacter amanitiformis]|uniref:Lipoprotein n=1 Tax=Ancylobacter amanitiformis TaxID=217069 RepID=A0ABU0LLT1_9HYPH|nr:hypothetical protein [Ancylobacter amanitiformis]MDQ0509659.1 hypothetical protein [Ancylobacter amanitiformis]